MIYLLRPILSNFLLPIKHPVSGQATLPRQTIKMAIYVFLIGANDTGPVGDWPQAFLSWCTVNTIFYTKWMQDIASKMRLFISDLNLWRSDLVGYSWDIMLASPETTLAAVKSTSQDWFRYHLEKIEITYYP